MRILGAILGIFSFLVSAYPCCIGDDCEPNSVENIAESEQDHKDDDCGLCSPFISCGSCSGFIPGADATVTPLEPQLITYSNLFGLSFKSVEAEISDRLWQPPQQVVIS